MKKITKEAFINYLEVIDAAGPNQPFCKGGRCPLAQYAFEILDLNYLFTLTNHYDPDFPNMSNKINPGWMTVFIEGIDALDLECHPFFRPSWARLSAHQCLAHLR